MTPIRRSQIVRRFLAPGRHFPLLLSLALLFLLHPLMVELGRERLIRVGFVLVLVLAAYSAASERRHLWGSTLFGLPAVLSQPIAYARPDGSAPLVAAILSLLFLVYTTVLVFRAVIRSGRVTGDKIAGAISVYLLLGLVWALLFGLMAMLDPASFRTPGDTPLGLGGGGEYAFIYYSFVTLTTLGYGEISPATHWSQTFAWMEAVTGQLFLAILIARLVGLHILHSTSEE